MTAYYNEIDPYAAQWLRNLMAAGHIAPGDVDGRSIVDVSADDLRGYTQAHFFAGIGGWSLALRLAGWSDDRPVWTGSCPCQPFSAAGKQLGTDDERHLWPVFFGLIRECVPPVVFGEQVASKAALEWWDVVAADLETEGYATGAADLCAASVGASHIRQRIFWVATNTGGVGNAGQGNATSIGAGGQRWSHRPLDLRAVIDSPYGGGDGFSQPLIRSRIDAVPSRVGRLRAYGNAIVPQVAAEFIGAVMELRP